MLETKIKSYQIAGGRHGTIQTAASVDCDIVAVLHHCYSSTPHYNYCKDKSQTVGVVAPRILGSQAFWIYPQTYNLLETH